MRHPNNRAKVRNVKCSHLGQLLVPHKVINSQTADSVQELSAQCYCLFCLLTSRLKCWNVSLTCFLSHSEWEDKNRNQKELVGNIQPILSSLSENYQMIPFGPIETWNRPSRSIFFITQSVAYLRSQSLIIFILQVILRINHLSIPIKRGLNQKWWNFPRIHSTAYLPNPLLQCSFRLCTRDPTRYFICTNWTG